MKTFLLGAVVAAGLILSATAFAATTLKGLAIVDNVTIGSQTVTKYTDQDTGTNCYALSSSFNANIGSISCVASK